MRVSGRVALVLMVLSASFGLAGCAAIEEIRQTFLRWVESERLPSGPGVVADELPEAAPVVPPENRRGSPPIGGHSRRTQRANCKGHGPSRFPQRNRRPRFHRSGEARRHRGAIRAVASIYSEVVGSLARSTASRPIFTLTRRGLSENDLRAAASVARRLGRKPVNLSGGLDSEQFRPTPRTG